MKKGLRKQQQDQIDEHAAPTEPLPDIAPLLPWERTAFTPFSPPQNQWQPLPTYPYPPPSDVRGYPYAPFLPGNPPAGNYNVWPGDATQNREGGRKQQTRRRWFLPACVSLFFIGVQLLLVVRFFIRLLSLSPNIAWINIVTLVSEIFVLPFRALWFQIPTVGTLFQANLELYTLIAVLVYGVLSRLLVGILKLRSKSR